MTERTGVLMRALQDYWGNFDKTVTKLSKNVDCQKVRKTGDLLDEHMERLVNDLRKRKDVDVNQLVRLATLLKQDFLERLGLACCRHDDEKKRSKCSAAVRDVLLDLRKVREATMMMARFADALVDSDASP